MPEEIIGLLRSKITFKWPDGHETIYPARALRLACRCALCIEETSGAPLLDPSSVPETIRAKQIDLCGQYAIQIGWTDGHDSGIYNFRDLRANCPCPICAQIRATGGVPTTQV
jgi:ATP-binding protein involved in chromosome partitioning